MSKGNNCLECKSVLPVGLVHFNHCVFNHLSSYCVFSSSRTVSGSFHQWIPASLFISYIGKISKGRCIEFHLFLSSFVFILSGLLSLLIEPSFLGQYLEILSQEKVCLPVTTDFLVNMDWEGGVEKEERTWGSCHSHHPWTRLGSLPKLSSPPQAAASALQQYSPFPSIDPKGACDTPSRRSPGHNLVWNARGLRQTWV